MNKIQKIITITLALFFSLMVGTQAFAREVRDIPDSGVHGSDISVDGLKEDKAKEEASSKNVEVSTSILKSDWQIEDILNLILRILTVGASILATGSIIFASFLYITAGGNSGQVQKAKTMIFNTVVGVIVYIFMWTILEWLIPGGVF